MKQDMKGKWAVWVWMLGAVGLSGQGVVSVVERSEPEGVIAEVSSSTAMVGSVWQTRVAPEVALGYRWAYWEVNGAAVRDGLGVAINPVRFEVTEAMTAVAWYVREDDGGGDSDGDGIWDALELRWYGELAQAAEGDSDGDGFDFMTELGRGYHPKVKNRLAEGGLASRRTAMVEVLTDLNYARLVQVSEPQGIVDTRGLYTLGTVVSLPTPPTASSGYRFIGWYRDGVRLDSSSAWPPVRVTVDAAEVTVVARYGLETEDSDADGIPDYLEVYHYDDLGAAGSGTDSDGDGFDFITELARGYHPLYGNRIEEGGIAGRRSWLWEYNSGYYAYVWSSLPTGLLDESGLVADGSWVTTPDLAGDARSGYNFAYWLVDGVAQRTANGVARGQVKLQANGPVAAVAQYVGSTEDSDNDGVADWQELVYFADLLAASGVSDGDGDGFDLLLELARGYHPLYGNRIEEGGIASRRSALVAVLLSIVSWGANDKNQVTVPEALAGLDLAAIASGRDHNIVLTDDGTLRGWGDDSEGQLQVPASAEPAVKVVSGYAHNIALREDGRVVGWGRNIFRQAVPPPNLRDVKNIAAGRDHSLALTEAGAVVAWGRNNAGQARVPTLAAAAIAVAGGGAHSLALLETGAVVAWGDNSRGQCNVPPGLSNAIMIAAGQYHSIALRSDGTLVVWGDSSFGQTTVPERVRNIVPRGGGTALGPQGDGLAPTGESEVIVEVTAGVDHSLVVFDDGSVVAWGRNDEGQATVPSDIGSVRHISAGEAHSVALVAGLGPQSGTPLRTLSVTDLHGSVARSPFKLGYADGEVVTLTATPAEGYVFSAWSGALSGAENPAAVTIAGDMAVTAEFVRDPAARFTVVTRIEDGGDGSGGSVLRSSVAADYGWDAPLTLTAVPAAGYRFVGWSGDVRSEAAEVTLSITGPVDTTARFVAEADAYGYWIEQHFGASASAPAMVVKHGRTVSLKEAWLLGEDPLDPHDVTMLEVLEVSGGGLQVRFRALPQRRYALLGCATLDGDWAPLEPEFVGDGGERTFTYSAGPGTPVFVRLRVGE